MKRRLAFLSLALVFVSALVLFEFPGRIVAQDRSPFSSLSFREKRQYNLTCAARYECDIQLESGERVNDGFNAHIDQWDPHIGYAGDRLLTPHLVLRPSRPGLRTNIILTTTKRTYYFLAFSTDREQPSYYSFSYGGEAYGSLGNLALATQAALRANGQGAVPAPTPAYGADLSRACFDFNYSYLVDRNVQSDHVPRAKPSTESLPASLVPKLVCSDGQHTYIDFPLQREVPSDLPISLAVTSEGDTLINYTYLSALNRYTVDGVYDSFVLELGSQAAPLRLRIYHAGRGNPPTGRRDPHPIPITTPPATANATVRAVATPAPAPAPARAAAHAQTTSRAQRS